MGTPTIRIAAPYWLPETVRRGTWRVEKLGYGLSWDQLDSRPRADPFETRDHDEQREGSLAHTCTTCTHIHTFIAHTHTRTSIYRCSDSIDSSRRKRDSPPSSLARCISSSSSKISRISSPRGSSRRSFDRSNDPLPRGSSATIPCLPLATNTKANRDDPS